MLFLLMLAYLKGENECMIVAIRFLHLERLMMAQTAIHLYVEIPRFIYDSIIIFSQFNEPPDNPVKWIFYLAEIAEGVIVSHYHKRPANHVVPIYGLWTTKY